MGITCSYNPYVISYVDDSLLSGYPVVCEAYTSVNHDNGHAFIIDGYKRTVKKYIYDYEWVYDNPDPTADQPGDMKREIEFSSPTIEYTMNWGHGGNNDMTFFSPSGDWGNNPYNWIYDRHIICNFNQ